MIHALRKKPKALMNLVYREELFPREAYRCTFHFLLDRHGARIACKTTVALRSWAHERGCEAELAEALSVALAPLSDYEELLEQSEEEAA